MSLPSDPSPGPIPSRPHPSVAPPGATPPGAAPHVAAAAPDRPLVDRLQGQLPHWWPLAALGTAGLALLLAIIALCVAALRDPLGSSLRNYDFSTPEKALVSKYKIQARHDLRAQMQLEDRLRGERIRERANTVEVKDKGESGGKKVLFVKYKEEGVPKYDVEWFEKDANSGLWNPTYQPENIDMKLANDIREWLATKPKDKEKDKDK